MSCDIASGGRGYWACLRSPEASLLQDEERLWTELIDKQAQLLTSGTYCAGNVALAHQKWAELAGHYQKAMQLAPAFTFAEANRTLALYAGGQTNEAMREMRCAG